MKRILLLAALLLCGCGGNQSLLNPAGIQAARISSLWWLYFIVCAAVFVIVLGAMFAAVVRRRAPTYIPEPPDVQPPTPVEHRRAVWVGAATVVSIVLLFVLLVGDFMTGRAIESLSQEDAMVIKVIGHQWWWEVRYEDPVPSNKFSTANEIHIPVGRTVKLELDSSDVIHSFWVPNLHGKRDMIPGHPTSTVLRADEPGEYWGQCAEFCGLQHAKMKLVVIAQPPEEYERWLANARSDSRQPQTQQQGHGLWVFEHRTCGTCHTIGGTSANGRVGPDLTHIASRKRIAAGTLPNVKGHLGGWILDPQAIKPGVRMPPSPLSGEDFRAVLEYLQILE